MERNFDMKIGMVRALPVMLMGIGGFLWIGSIPVLWLRTVVTIVVIVAIVATTLKSIVSARGSL
jgi:hypothetical protein